MIAKTRVALIVPPNAGVLGGVGYARDENGKRYRVPLFPLPEGAKDVEIRGGIRLKGSVPQLGILYLAAQLEEAGYEVVLVDYQVNRLDLSRLVETVRQSQLIGITTIAGSKDKVHRIHQAIRNDRPGVPIVIGGPDATINPESYAFDDPYTTVFRGESGHSALDLIGQMVARSSPTATSGEEPAQMTLDDYPYPARHLVDHRRYRFLGSLKTGSILTSSGCPFACRYCGRSELLCYRYQPREPKLVLNELEMMHGMGYKVVAIADSNFTAQKGHAEEILQGMLDRRLKLVLTASLSVHNASADLYALAHAAGVMVFSFGIESANDETLAYFDKKATREKNERAIRLASQAGIFVKANLIYGAKTEDWEATMRTIKWTCRMPIDIAHFCALSIVKGSPLWNEALAESKIGPLDSSVPACVENSLGGLTREELAAAYRKANVSFYLRPGLWGRIRRKLWLPQNRYLIPLVAKAGCSLLRSSG